jgi:hypothetical protein
VWQEEAKAGRCFGPRTSAEVRVPGFGFVNDLAFDDASARGSRVTLAQLPAQRARFPQQPPADSNCCGGKANEDGKRQHQAHYKGRGARNTSNYTPEQTHPWSAQLRAARAKPVVHVIRDHEF